MKIGDIRGREDQFDLNTQGFQFFESPTVGGDFRDTEKVKKEVYPETEELLKKVYGSRCARSPSEIESSLVDPANALQHGRNPSEGLLTHPQE